jgi:hypothetical protein
MGVSPSGQDEDQAKARMYNTSSYVLRVICNKPGLMSLSFFDFEGSVKFDNVAWVVEKESENDVNNKLTLINSILLDPSIDSSIKYENICKTMKDDGYELIVEKVKALKEFNIPKKTAIVHNYYGAGFGVNSSVDDKKKENISRKDFRNFSSGNQGRYALEDDPIAYQESLLLGGCDDTYYFYPS